MHSDASLPASGEQHRARLRMVFMGDRRPKQREDTVTGRLGRVTAITLDRVDHDLQCRIDNRACLFGVLDVGEQRGDRLALAFGRRRVVKFHQCELCSGWLRLGDRETERSSSLPTELESRRVLEVAFRTDQCEPPGALTAEFHSIRIVRPAFRAAHFPAPRVPQVAFSTRLQSSQDVPMLPIPFPDRN